MNKKVLTVQDISCFGQCSTTVALPILCACGVETAIMPSVRLALSGIRSGIRAR